MRSRLAAMAGLAFTLLAAPGVCAQQVPELGVIEVILPTCVLPAVQVTVALPALPPVDASMLPGSARAPEARWQAARERLRRVVATASAAERRALDADTAEAGRELRVALEAAVASLSRGARLLLAELRLGAAQDDVLRRHEACDAASEPCDAALDASSAIELWSRLDGNDLIAAQAFLRAGYSLGQMGRRDAAIVSFNRAAALAAVAPEVAAYARFFLAEDLEATGDLAGAIAHLDELARRGPGSLREAAAFRCLALRSATGAIEATVTDAARLWELTAVEDLRNDALTLAAHALTRARGEAAVRVPSVVPRGLRAAMLLRTAELFVEQGHGRWASAIFAALRDRPDPATAARVTALRARIARLRDTPSHWLRRTVRQCLARSHPWPTGAVGELGLRVDAPRRAATPRIRVLRADPELRSLQQCLETGASPYEGSPPPRGHATVRVRNQP